MRSHAVTATQLKNTAKKQDCFAWSFLHAFSDGICNDYQLLFMMPQESLDHIQQLTVMTQLNYVYDWSLIAATHYMAIEKTTAHRFHKCCTFWEYVQQYVRLMASLNFPYEWIVLFVLRVSLRKRQPVKGAPSLSPNDHWLDGWNHIFT